MLNKAWGLSHRMAFWVVCLTQQKLTFLLEKSGYIFIWSVSKSKSWNISIYRGNEDSTLVIFIN